MKKEDLYEGLGALNDDVLKRSEKEEGTMKKSNMSKVQLMIHIKRHKNF